MRRKLSSDEQECEIARGRHNRANQRGGFAAQPQQEPGADHGNRTAAHENLCARVGEGIQTGAGVQKICDDEDQEIEDIAADDVADRDVKVADAEQGDGAGEFWQTGCDTEQKRAGEALRETEPVGDHIGRIGDQNAGDHDADADENKADDNLTEGEGRVFLLIFLAVLA